MQDHKIIKILEDKKEIVLKEMEEHHNNTNHQIGAGLGLASEKYTRLIDKIKNKENNYNAWEEKILENIKNGIDI